METTSEPEPSSLNAEEPPAVFFGDVAGDTSLVAEISSTVVATKPKSNQVAPAQIAVPQERPHLGKVTKGDEPAKKASFKLTNLLHTYDVYDDGAPLTGVEDILKQAQTGNDMRLLPESNNFHKSTTIDKFVDGALEGKKYGSRQKLAGVASALAYTRAEVVHLLKEHHIDVEELRDMESSELVALGIATGVAKKLLAHIDAPAGGVNFVSDFKVPIRHMFMIKTISEDKDGEIWLLGTFVQNQMGSDRGFEWRINDVSCDDDYIHERRATHYKNIGSRRTYNVRLPMKRSLIWADFPYQIFRCSCLIEMSSRTETTPTGEECEVRPNLWLDIEDERSLVVIRDHTKMDDLDTMRRFFPTPTVEMTYDKGKEYCPKYEVTFYLEKMAQQKIYSLIMPLVLIAALTTYNVMMGAKGGSNGYGPGLDNSIALALTMVFLMEGIDSGPTLDEGYVPWYAMTDEIFIILMFIGQALAALITPEGFTEGNEQYFFQPNFTETQDVWTLKYKVINWTGLAMVWLAILIPFVNIYQRSLLFSKCMKSGGVIEYSYKVKKDVEDKKTGKKTGKTKEVTVRCDANHKCMKMRVQKSTFEVYTHGTEAPEKIKKNAKVLEETLKMWHRVYLEVPYEEKEFAKSNGAKWDAEKKKWWVQEMKPELEKYIKEDEDAKKLGTFVPGSLIGKSRPAFMKNASIQNGKDKDGEVILVTQKTPQKDVFTKYPNKDKKGSSAWLEKQQTRFGGRFPECDAEDDDGKKRKMTVEDYGDPKKFPDLDFLNLQVPVGLKAPTEPAKFKDGKEVKVTVMHPRLRSVWRVHEDTGKTLQVVCGPKWPSDITKYKTDIFDKIKWKRKKTD